MTISRSMFITTAPVLMSLSLHHCELTVRIFPSKCEIRSWFPGLCGGVGMAAPTVLREQGTQVHRYTGTQDLD